MLWYWKNVRLEVECECSAVSCHYRVRLWRIYLHNIFHGPILRCWFCMALRIYDPSKNINYFTFHFILDLRLQTTSIVLRVYFFSLEILRNEPGCGNPNAHSSACPTLMGFEFYIMDISNFANLLILGRLCIHACNIWKFNLLLEGYIYEIKNQIIHFYALK